MSATRSCTSVSVEEEREGYRAEGRSRAALQLFFGTLLRRHGEESGHAARQPREVALAFDDSGRQRNLNLFRFLRLVESLARRIVQSLNAERH